MKTFKMISISVLHEGQFLHFPIKDGIMINQENSHRMWILEMFIDETHKGFFEELMKDNELLEAKVVISYPENEPAGFIIDITAVKQIKDSLSVLMKGRLKRVRTQYAEQLLEELIGEGLAGKELLESFEVGMLARPPLKRDYKESKSDHQK